MRLRDKETGKVYEFEQLLEEQWEAITDCVAITDSGSDVYHNGRLLARLVCGKEYRLRKVCRWGDFVLIVEKVRDK